MSTAPHILVPDRPEFRAQRWEGVEVTFYGKGPLPALGNVQGVVAWNAPEDQRRELLALSGLQWILTLTAGVDGWLPLLPPQVALYNAHHLHSDAVAQHATALLLGVARGLHRFARAQHWPASLREVGPLHTLQGRQVVVWGYGHIGKKVQALLEPLGATVTGIRSATSPAERDAALGQADDLVLLLPLTQHTRHIVGADTLARLKPGAWLYNLGRGPLVDTQALLGALDAGTLGGAALDVTEPEPLPAAHPLWQRENVLITPHIASTTDDLPLRGAAYANDFVGRWRRSGWQLGEALDNRVQTGKGY